MNRHNLSTEPYKGVRDFYPEDMAVQNHIFDIWKKAARRFGYEEYGGSILEPADLYRAKSGEEIVNDQTYTFTDRGDREVTLRPEMTPTVARMVAARKRELSFPVRWFSIPNLFRYEQPQRGRLREHWQLNVDIFGIESLDAEVEVISLASSIMHDYGLKDTDYEIRINSRKVMNYVLLDVFGLTEEQAQRASKLIDRRDKISPDKFSELAADILGNETKLRSFITLLESKNFEEFTSHLPQTTEEHQGLRDVRTVLAALDAAGVKNARFDQTLMRGFDYYTGIVFEVFDLHPDNRRAIFGGGRYDDLLSIFGGDKVPAVGFGTGDVTARNILETYNLLPKNTTGADIAVLPMDTAFIGFANDIASNLRTVASVAIDYTVRKIGDKIKAADKNGVRYVVVIGESEKNTGTVALKHLASGTVTEATLDSIADTFIKLQA